MSTSSIAVTDTTDDIASTNVSANDRVDARLRRRFPRRIAVAVAALTAAAVAALPASPASASPITISTSGQYGYWSTEIGKNLCSGAWFSAYIQSEELLITTAPAYASYTQVVGVTTTIEYWTGTEWRAYWTQSTSTTRRPVDRYVQTSSPTVSVARGRFYRVKQSYTWSVGGRVVGTATNLFDRYSYMTYGGASILESGTSPSYCYVQ